MKKILATLIILPLLTACTYQPPAYESDDVCSSTCELEGYTHGECMTADEIESTEEDLGIGSCRIEHQVECGEDCECLCSN